MMFDNVRLVRETFPDKKLLFTEGAAESFKAEDIHNWRLGEHYGRSMINDFNDGAVGWTDWNVLLDEQGGPNHVGNFCFAPVHADTKTGELIYTNSYHYIGHFSKFVRPGRAADRQLAEPERAALDGVRESGRQGLGGGDEPTDKRTTTSSGWPATRRRSAACRIRFRRSSSEREAAVSDTVRPWHPASKQDYSG